MDCLSTRRTIDIVDQRFAFDSRALVRSLSRYEWRFDFRGNATLVANGPITDDARRNELRRRRRFELVLGILEFL